VNPLTLAYRAALGGIVGGLLARLLAAWLALYDDDRPLESSARVGAIAAPWISGAQLAAADLAAAWLAALTAEAAGVPFGRVAPYRVPPGLVGTSARGGPMREATRLAPVIWWARLSAGQDRGAAAEAAAGWLGRLAASEPYRAANQTVVRNAVEDPRLTGRMRRETRAGSCSFCSAIADRGYASARAGFPAHAHCRCTATPEIGPTRR
jgi:hypothetical protein